MVSSTSPHRATLLPSADDERHDDRETRSEAWRLTASRPRTTRRTARSVEPPLSCDLSEARASATVECACHRCFEIAPHASCWR